MLSSILRGKQMNKKVIIAFGLILYSSICLNFTNPELSENNIKPVNNSVETINQDSLLKTNPELPQPVKKDGYFNTKYYSSDQDNHEFLSASKIMWYILNKPIKTVQDTAKNIVSKFYGENDKKEPEHISDPVEFLKPQKTVPVKKSIEPVLTWIGHSTFLIQADGFNVLTDPIFDTNITALFGLFTVTRRKMPAGIKIADIPAIDAIVISHNHHDHMDLDALVYLSKKYNPVIFVPAGNKDLVSSMGFTRVVEMTWWDQNVLTKNGALLKLTCLPAYHWSTRGLLDYRASLWCGWMLNFSSKNIYFAGDTAYGDFFKDIAKVFPKIDIALMPIGPTSEGENKHKNCHVDAKESVDAFIDLNAEYFVPMHYGTFFLSKETLEYPVEKLKAYWQARSDDLQDKKLLHVVCGQQYNLLDI